MAKLMMDNRNENKLYSTDSLEYCWLWDRSYLVNLLQQFNNDVDKVLEEVKKDHTEDFNKAEEDGEAFFVEITLNQIYYLKIVEEFRKNHKQKGN